MADFTLVITVPDNMATDILNSVTDHLGYDGTGTRAEFLRGRMRDELKNIYINSKNFSITY